jgi:Tol biopolymer transport system component
LDALFVISKDTGEKRQLTNPEPPTGGDTNPAVSPDSNWLVFRRPVGGMYTGVLYALRLGKGMTGAGEPQRLTPVGLDASFPTWMPNGREVLFSSRGSLWRLLVPAGTASRIPFVGEDGLMPVVSRPQPERPSRLVYVRSLTDENLWRVDTSAPGLPALRPPVVAVASTRRDGMPQLSPDGLRVAFTSDRSGEWEIWVSDLNGSNSIQLTFIRAIASGYPHWSPDGKRIVFHSNVEGQWDVFSVPAGGGKPQNLTSNPARDYFPNFSRDGRWIYFNSSRTGERGIWKMPAAGGDPVPVLDFTGEAPQESPDGAWLYFVESIAGSSPLWRMPLAGGPAVKILEAVDLMNFAVLDRGVYYIDRVSGGEGIHYFDRSAGETRLRYFDLTTRKSRTVVPNLGDVEAPVTASADGRTILYSRQDSSVDDLMLVENFR